MQIELLIKKKLHSASGEFLLNADLKIENGEIISFFGPSGAGKTTMLRFIAGLTDAEQGFLKVGDETWYDSANNINVPARKRKIGFVFQNYAIFPNMSIRENLKFAQQKSDKKHVDELLELFELTGLQHRKPGMLSGGQNQRVALARALARKPDLLLLDEPLSALDMEMRNCLQNEILQIHRVWGITIILVSHDLPEVFKLSSRVISFREGCATDEGDPYGIFGKSKISGKLQFVADVLRVDKEDVVDVLTLLIGNTPVKIAVCKNTMESFLPGDKALIISKVFNPIIQKINS